MDTKTEQAILRLMPLGGYSVNDGVITVHKDGIKHGYTVPTQAEIDASVSAHEAKELTEAPYRRLDAIDAELTGKLARMLEDMKNGQAFDVSVQALLDEKVTIRAGLAI